MAHVPGDQICCSHDDFDPVRVAAKALKAWLGRPVGVLSTRTASRGAACQSRFPSGRIKPAGCRGHRDLGGTAEAATRLPTRVMRKALPKIRVHPATCNAEGSCARNTAASTRAP